MKLRTRLITSFHCIISLKKNSQGKVFEIPLFDLGFELVCNLFSSTVKMRKDALISYLHCSVSGEGADLWERSSSLRFAQGC